MIIRDTTIADYGQIAEIYAYAREQMRQAGFLTLVNRILWQKPHNCGFFYVKFIKF